MVKVGQTLYVRRLTITQDQPDVLISLGFIHMTTFGDDLPPNPLSPCTTIRAGQLTGVGHNKQKAIASDHMNQT